MDKYIGKRLEGRYDILELIGKGGMANVYRAHDTIDDRTVAVKILRDEYMNNADFVRRFKNESKAIALLNHPNIVRVYDVSFSDTQSIVMEYIDGVTLKEYIDHTGALPWKDAVHFTLQILHALQHAHNKGIVHRDIKPQNIMLLRTGEIKVTDFGIARFARSESRTIADRAIGSVHYISPEQALGEYTDDKSDIYSTGIMLFEMLTGQLPFEADTAVSVAIQQIQTPIKKPRDINPSIPIGLEEITLRAVQKEPQNRYQSATEMISALEQFRGNPDIRFGYASTPTQDVPSKTNENTRPKRGKQMAGKSSAPKRKPVKRKSSYLRMMLIVTIAVVLGSAGFIGLMIWQNDPFAETPQDMLPNFIGEKIDGIDQRYPKYKFTIEKEEYSDEYPKGEIFEQKPKSGMSVKDGSIVKLWVSGGKQSIEIPNVEGDSAAKSMHILRGMGLEPIQERQNHEDVAAGRIIATDPSPGKVLSAGDTVTIYVSEGPKNKMISIPDFVGMKEESARNLVTQRKFTLGTVTEKESDLPKGTVIEQNPPAGALHNQNTMIDLVISKGGLQRYSIAIPLPTTMDRDVTMKALVRQGDKNLLIDEEVLNPSTSSTGIWNPSFPGKKDEVLTIIIALDDYTYQEYELDFRDGSHKILHDYSRAQEFKR